MRVILGIEGLARRPDPIPYHCLLSEHIPGDICPIPMLKSLAGNATQVDDIFSIANCVNRLWKKYQLVPKARHSPCYYHLHQTQRRVEAEKASHQVLANESNCFTKGSSAGGVAGDDCESDPGERLHFRPTTLFSFFDSKLETIIIKVGRCEQQRPVLLLFFRVISRFDRFLTPLLTVLQFYECSASSSRSRITTVTRVCV